MRFRTSDRCVAGLLVFSCGLFSAAVEAGEPPVTPGAAGKEARETIEAAAQYTAQEKDAFQRKAREELALLQKRLASLQAETDRVSASARTELQKSIRELEGQKEAVRKQLDGLKSATDATWSEVQAGVHRAIEELDQSYQRLRSRLP